MVSFMKTEKYQNSEIRNSTLIFLVSLELMIGCASPLRLEFVLSSMCCFPEPVKLPVIISGSDSVLLINACASCPLKKNHFPISPLKLMLVFNS